MTAICIIPNCNRSAPAHEAFCSVHRDKPTAHDEAIKAAFLAGCERVLRWTHTGMDRDALEDEAIVYLNSLKGKP